MIEITVSDIWYCPCKTTHAVVVPTNGIIRQNGCAVMGKGMAKQADILFNLSSKLGKYIQMYGNRPFNMGFYMYNNIKFRILTCPTKNDWKDKSDIELIKKSCKYLVELANKFGIETIFMPPLGCGAGQLDYAYQVRPILDKLDNRFVVVFHK